jgi:predicted negative regulator of RcsB-dependent stress response
MNYVKDRRLGIKENLQAVKEEISTEEQFLEGMIKSERFFKRNKKYLLAILVVCVVGSIGYSIQTMMEINRLKQSNEAYMTLLSDPNNAQALSLLKQKNEKLYTMYELQLALTTNDKDVLTRLSNATDTVVSAIASYGLSQVDKQSVPKGELFAGMVALQEGYALLKDAKINEAKVKFAQIDINSPLKQVAQNLEHYQGLKK